MGTVGPSWSVHLVALVCVDRRTQRPFDYELAYSSLHFGADVEGGGTAQLTRDRVHADVLGDLLELFSGKPSPGGIYDCAGARLTVPCVGLCAPDSSIISSAFFTISSRLSPLGDDPAALLITKHLHVNPRLTVAAGRLRCTQGADPPEPGQPELGAKRRSHLVHTHHK